MKLWILDADAIIEMLELGVFENLVRSCEVHLATTVISEVTHYYNNGVKTPIDLRATYVQQNLVVERSASASSLGQVVAQLPPFYKIHDGEKESLAVLMEDDDLTLCTIDMTAIRVLPFLDLSERIISLESILKSNGITISNPEDKYTDEYVKNNLDIGREQKIYHM